MNDPKSPTQGNKPSEGSGSDTVSAAKISAGGSGGTVGQPPKPQPPMPQGSTLASHTSKPMGGGAGATGAGNQPQSRGPEHMRHQDKDAGQGIGSQARGAGEGMKQSAQSTTDAVRDAAGQAQEKAGELYEEASERAGELYEQASDWAREKYDQASSWASDQYENSGRYADQGRRYAMQGVGQAGSSVQRFVRENPVLVGVVGLAAGLLLGALLPRTRREDRTMGRWSDELRDQGMRYARDMTQRGRQFVDDAFADGDPRFASHESEWRQGDQDSRRGPSGRYQNH